MTDLNQYMQNAQGHLVPKSSVKEIDKLRNTLVVSILDRVNEMRDQMSDFKLDLMADVNQFMGIVAAEYEKKHDKPKETKGNFTLTSYDGRLKVQVSIADTLAFDERIQIAKTMIDECIHRWTVDSDDKVKALIEHAFQTDKAGKISTARVLGLFKLDFKDEQWTKAMTAIRDSLSVSSSKSYICFYQRATVDDKFERIALDMAAL